MGEWPGALPRIPVRSWTCSRGYPGTLEQVAEARAFLRRLLHGCPAVNDAVLLCSELAANAVQYSASRADGGQFSVHVRAQQGSYVWAGVQDRGGPWEQRPRDTGRMHGLDIVRALAGDGCWGITGGFGGRLVWYRLAWASEPRPDEAGCP